MEDSIQDLLDRASTSAVDPTAGGAPGTARGSLPIGESNSSSVNLESPGGAEGGNGYGGGFFMTALSSLQASVDRATASPVANRDVFSTPNAGQTAQRTSSFIRVSAFSGDESNGVCWGAIAQGNRVCIKPINECAYGHRIKKPLEDGFYVSAEGSHGSVFPTPFIPLEEADRSEGFRAIRDMKMTAPALMHLLTTLDSSGDTSEESKEKAESLLSVSKGEEGSPKKRLRLDKDGDFDPNLIRTVNNMEGRLTMVEMRLGPSPPEGNGGETLFGTIQAVEEMQTSLETTMALATTAGVKAQSTEDQVVQLQSITAPSTTLTRQVQEMNNTVLEVVKRNEELERHLKQALGIIVNLSDKTTVLSDKTAMLERSAGSGGGGRTMNGGVSSVELATYQKDMAERLREMEQALMNTEVMIGVHTFRDLQDCTDFARENFPPGVITYECLVGFNALLQHAATKPSTQADLQLQEMHAHKLNRTFLQNGFIASFTLVRPQQFDVKGVGLNKTITSLPTADSWQPHGIGGMRKDLVEQIREQAEYLKKHIATVLAHHVAAKMLCLEILLKVETWWTWFHSTFTDFHAELLRNACPDVLDPPKKVRDSTWKVASSALLAMFDEFHKVRNSASSAHRAADIATSTGLYLFATLQELRIMDDFQRAYFEEHPRIQILKMTHVFSNYVPRSEFDVGRVNTRITEMGKTVDQLVTKVNVVVGKKK